MPISPFISPVLSDDKGVLNKEALDLYERLLQARTYLLKTSQFKLLPLSLKTRLTWSQRVAIARFAYAIRVPCRSDKEYIAQCAHSYNMVSHALNNLKSTNKLKRHGAEVATRNLLIGIMQDYELGPDDYVFT